MSTAENLLALNAEIPQVEHDKDVLMAAGAVALEGLHQILLKQGIALQPLLLSIGGKVTALSVDDLVFAMKSSLNQSGEGSNAIH